MNLLRHRKDIVAVLNGDDAELKKRVSGDIAVEWFGSGGRFTTDGEHIYDGSNAIYSASGTPLLGRHNLQNICGVLTALAAAGGDPLNCKQELATFTPLRHRLERVADIAGVMYVNDSISTTPFATLAAIEAFKGRAITLLLGGYERDEDYSGLIADVISGDGVKAVLTLPDNGDRIYREFNSVSHGAAPELRIEQVDGVEAAVVRASEITPAGGVVLLSPGAPSYGRFENFEQRGDLFVAQVKALSK
jgi:UDP-N-acetylmuramoylalanine--D-glutamate ligase